MIFGGLGGSNVVSVTNRLAVYWNLCYNIRWCGLGLMYVSITNSLAVYWYPCYDIRLFGWVL